MNCTTCGQPFHLWASGLLHDLRMIDLDHAPTVAPLRPETGVADTVLVDGVPIDRDHVPAPRAEVVAETEPTELGAGGPYAWDDPDCTEEGTTG